MSVRYVQLLSVTYCSCNKYYLFSFIVAVAIWWWACSNIVQKNQMYVFHRLLENYPVTLFQMLNCNWTWCDVWLCLGALSSGSRHKKNEYMLLLIGFRMDAMPHKTLHQNPLLIWRGIWLNHVYLERWPLKWMCTCMWRLKYSLDTEQVTTIIDVAIE